MSKKSPCPMAEDELRNAYARTHSARKLAAEHSVSAPTVLKWLRDAGIDTTRKIKGATTTNGYRAVIVYPDWPFYEEMAVNRDNKQYSSYVLEHRKVMAEHLGRPLLRTETIHHKDGNRLNNSIENLQLRHGKHGNGVVLVCQSCGSHDVVATSL